MILSVIRCGRLTHHIALPYSIIGTGHLETAIRDTYCDRICGECTHEVRAGSPPRYVTAFLTSAWAPAIFPHSFHRTPRPQRSANEEQMCSPLETPSCLRRRKLPVTTMATTTAMATTAMAMATITVYTHAGAEGMTTMVTTVTTTKGVTISMTRCKPVKSC